MLPLSRVVWSEGMHLAQHHFQAQSRYFENSINFALSHLFFKSYGLAGCELDAEALRNGTASLIHARGVMPDGLAFHFPDADPLPEPREIRDLFSPTEHKHLIALTIPPYRQGHSNCATDGDINGRDVRYRAETSQFVDETTGRDEKPVDLSRKNFRLVLDTEVGDEFVSLPIARVIRDGTGHFVYDPDYIPPCVQIGASSRLMELLRRLIEILEAKSDSMLSERRSDQKSLADYATHEVANFWLLHAIQSSLAPLRHQLEVKRTHPELLYKELVRLGGALCTFSLESHPRDLPSYDHDDLVSCFRQLEQHVRKHLDIIIPKNCVSVPLERKRPLLHTGQVTDQRCMGPSEWIIGVRSGLGESEILRSVPTLVKICSAKFISRVVKEARGALALEHLPTPPSEISPRIGSHYFRINKKGPCWDAIQQSKDVGIYVPGDLTDAELELLVVLQE